MFALIVHTPIISEIFDFEISALDKNAVLFRRMTAEHLRYAAKMNFASLFVTIGGTPLRCENSGARSYSASLCESALTCFRSGTLPSGLRQ